MQIEASERLNFDFYRPFALLEAMDPRAPLPPRRDMNEALPPAALIALARLLARQAAKEALQQGSANQMGTHDEEVHQPDR